MLRFFCFVLQMPMSRETFLAGLCAILWTAGFFFSLPIVQPYEWARLLSVGCILTGAVVALHDSKIANRPSSSLVVAGLFCMAVALSVAMSAVPFAAFIGACAFGILPASFISGMTMTRARADFWRVCCWGGGVIILLLALWAPVQLAFFPQLLVHRQVRFPFANPASYAALLMLGFFPALSLATDRNSVHGGLARRGAALLAMATAVGIAVIGSLGVIIVTIGGVVLFTSWGKDRQRRHRSLLFLTLFFTAIFAVAALHGFHFFDKTESLQARLALWRATVSMIAARPWTGTGFGTYALYYPQYRLPADVASGGFRAHCDPLQFAAEAGVPAMLLFYGFVGLAGWRMWCFMRRADRDVSARQLALALFCGLAAMVVHAHVDFDLYQPAILAVAGLLLGLWYQETAPVAAQLLEGPELSSRRLRVFPTAAALGTIVLLLILQGFLRSEATVDQGNIFLARGDLDGFVAAINRADRLAWHRNARAQVAAADIPLGILRSPLQILMIDKTQELRTQVRRFLDEAEKNNPRLVAIPYDRALLATTYNDRLAQEKYLRAALALDPLHLPSRIMLARLYTHEGRNADALALLEDGLRWAPIVRRQVPGAPEYFALLARSGHVIHN